MVDCEAIEEKTKEDVEETGGGGKRGGEEEKQGTGIGEECCLALP